jgi:hypothetical protein
MHIPGSAFHSTAQAAPSDSCCSACKAGTSGWRMAGGADVIGDRIRVDRFDAGPCSDIVRRYLRHDARRRLRLRERRLGVEPFPDRVLVR